MVYVCTDQDLTFGVTLPGINYRALKSNIAQRFLEIQESYQLDDLEYILNPWILEVSGFQVKLSIDNNIAEDHEDAELIPSLLIYLKVIAEIRGLDKLARQLTYRSRQVDSGYSGILTVYQGVTITRVDIDDEIERAIFSLDDLRNRKFMIRSLKDDEEHDAIIQTRFVLISNT